MGDEILWGDDDTDKEMNADDVERYKASAKKKDLIRIVSNPIKYYSHSLDKPPYYVNCAKIKGRCILCEREIQRGIKIGCVVIHIADKSMSGRGKFEKVGTCKVWLFGKDKWKTLTGIIDDYAQGDANWLKKQDLIVTCVEEQFQDLEIRPTLRKSTATREMGVNFKNAKSKLDWYAQPADLNRQKEALGESVDTDDDLDFDDTNGGIDPIDDPIDDPTDSTTRMPDEPVFDDEVSDIQTEKVEGGVADILDEIDTNGVAPF